LNPVFKVLKKPSYFYKYPVRIVKKRATRERFIRKVFKDHKEFLSFSKEIITSDLIDTLDNAKKDYKRSVSGKTYRGNPYSFGAIDYEVGSLLYAFIRKTKPCVLVETGVCNGVSTAFILLALSQNRNGRLYSIDLPEVEGVDYKEWSFWEGKGGATIPKNKEPGWIIPHYLKKRWKLFLGKSQDVLPPLLKELKKIDFFFHDSEHSYECMTFEFNEAFKALNKSGILASHDITQNDSFYKFCKNQRIKPMKISLNLGFAIK